MSDSETSRRWLMKALREASGEMHELMMRALRRSMPEAEALIERAWRHETIAAWQLGHLAVPGRRRPAAARLRVAGAGHAFPDCYEQLREWYHTREQISGVLYMMSPFEWEQTANHRFRGELSVESIARSMHQTDLEILNTLRAQLEMDDAPSSLWERAGVRVRPGYGGPSPSPSPSGRGDRTRNQWTDQPSAEATSEAARAKFIV